MVVLFSATNQGGRPYQEDTYANVQLTPYCYFAGIFDGHGGGAVSKMCAGNFPEVIKQGILDTPYDIGQTVRSSFYILDNLAFHMNEPYVGSTVVFCLVCPDAVWFANAGDSMIMVGYVDGTCQSMSQEHKVEKEKERIESEGGLVTHFDGVARINGNLNVSRAIGDHHLKQWVNCNPYVRSISSEKGNIKYIILASDGIWDVLNESALNSIVLEYMSRTENKNEIIPLMLSRIIHVAQSFGSTDNITITYLEL